MKKLFISLAVLTFVVMLSQSTHAQRRNRSGSPAATAVKPCNQLTGDDLLVRGRKCSMPNGQVTTVGSFCDDMTSLHAGCRARVSSGTSAALNGQALRPCNELITGIEWPEIRNQTCSNSTGQKTTVGKYCGSPRNAQVCGQQPASSTGQRNAGPRPVRKPN